MHVQDNTFLITGGCSGLGVACVRRLADLGAKIVVCDIRGDSVADRYPQAVRFVQADVTSESEVARAVAAALEISGGCLRGIINCAGIAPAERVLGREQPHSLKGFSKVIEVNLIGTFNVIRLAAAAMQTAAPDPHGERGVIINTASVAAYDGQIGQAAYAASKGGVTAMTLPIARELARYAIRVVTIAPGLFDTPMRRTFPDKVRTALAQQCVYPMRFGQPEEFAALAQHVIENPMLNGEVIRLDGAVRMAAK
jgi:NAD(P)-dependent dehydrogenase (short-subunit alcohol dehydrogenase family)